MLADIEQNRPEIWRKSLADLENTPNAIGLFWRIEKDGAPPSWLLGTMHLPDPEVPARKPAITEAFAKADTVALEVAGLSGEGRNALAEKLLPLAQLPGSESFDAGFTKEQQDALGAMTAAIGMPYFAARRMQPWFLAIALSTPPCVQLAMLHGDEGIDGNLEKDANAAGKRVVGLESLDEQLDALVSLKSLVGGNDLLEIAKLGPDKMADLFATLLQTYVEERPWLDMAVTMNLPELKQSAETFGAMQAAFLHDRNLRMRDRLLPILDHGGAFIGVGALHLPGDDGLIELLRASGYAVTRIE
jgi:uncharacterized protein YbaP (TraB family)